jgi:hypothetical protein
MNVIDNLLTIAEIAVALAGFAGIIATFQLGQIEHISRGRVLALWMVVNISLGVGLFSLLPLGLINFGFEDGVVWAISSTLIAIVSIIEVPFIIRNMNLQRENYSVRIVFYSIELVGFVLVVVNFLNALGIVFHREFGPFLAIIIYSLFLVGWNFSRLLMQPLWKMVEEREGLASHNR